jgi:predicted HTH domain antitoxin
MNDKVVSIPIPNGLPQALKMSDEEFCAEARSVLAAKLYEMGRVSLGVAAEIAGMPRLDFLGALTHYGVPAINLKDEEVAHEIQAARELAEQ